MRAFVAGAVLITGLIVATVQAEQSSQKYNGPRTRDLGIDAQKGQEPKTSALVSAAKKAKETKKKSRISITDESVKKSTGKLTLLPPAPEPEETAKNGEAPAPEIVAKRANADAKLSSAKIEVEELEKELRRIEETYYLESDPSYRDEVLRPRFEQTRKQLDRARDLLLTARDERQILEPAAEPPPENGTRPD
jgi:hypothetical protein